MHECQCQFLTVPSTWCKARELSVCLQASGPVPLPEAVPKSLRFVGYLVLLLSSCTTERRVAQPDNVDVFVLILPDEIQCKPASFIAARCLGCCPFVTYSVCVRVWRACMQVGVCLCVCVCVCVCACVCVCVCELWD